MKREVNVKKAEDLKKMKSKVLSLRQKIILPEQFRRIQGSRKLKGRFAHDWEDRHCPGLWRSCPFRNFLTLGT